MLHSIVTRLAMLAATILAFAAVPASAGDMPAPEGAAAYIISPADGAKIKGTVHVVFGLRGIGVAPAGVEKPKTGHHHLLIDTPLPTGDALREPIPNDENHRHFGGGQTETTVELTPGKHTLQLLLADHNHIPHDPPVASDQITIWVE